MNKPSGLRKIIATTALLGALAGPALAAPNDIDRDFLQLTQKGKEVCYGFFPIPPQYGTLYWTKDVYYDRKLNLIHIRDGNYALYTSQEFAQTEVVTWWEDVVEQYAVKRQEEIKSRIPVPRIPEYTIPRPKENICCPQKEEKFIIVPVPQKEAEEKHKFYINHVDNLISIGTIEPGGELRIGDTNIHNPPPAPEKEGKYTAKALAGVYYDEDFKVQPDLGFVVFATPTFGVGATAAFGNKDDTSATSIRGRLEYAVKNADLHVEAGIRSLKKDAASSTDGIFGIGAGIHGSDLGIEGTLYLIENEPGIGVRLTKLFSP